MHGLGGRKKHSIFRKRGSVYLERGLYEAGKRGPAGPGKKMEPEKQMLAVWSE